RRSLRRLQHLEPADIQEESVIAEQFGQLRRRRVAFGENFRIYLVQRLLELRFVQSHGPVLSGICAHHPARLHRQKVTPAPVRTNAMSKRSRPRSDIRERRQLVLLREPSVLTGFPPPYSITSSARASSVAGRSNP